MNRSTLRHTFVMLIAALGFAFAGPASATIFYVSGTIENLVDIDSGFGPNDDWVSLNGVGPQGGCTTGGDRHQHGGRDQG
jgi:hypothetical protein